MQYEWGKIKKISQLLIKASKKISWGGAGPSSAKIEVEVKIRNFDVGNVTKKSLLRINWFDEKLIFVIKIYHFDENSQNFET